MWFASGSKIKAAAWWRNFVHWCADGSYAIFIIPNVFLIACYTCILAWTRIKLCKLWWCFRFLSWFNERRQDIIWRELMIHWPTWNMNMFCNTPNLRTFSGTSMTCYLTVVIYAHQRIFPLRHILSALTSPVKRSEVVCTPKFIYYHYTASSQLT